MKYVITKRYMYVTVLVLTQTSENIVQHKKYVQKKRQQYLSITTQSAGKVAYS